MSTTFKIGDKVRMNFADGSWGTIIGSHPTLTDRYYIKYCYGLDKQSEPIYEYSSLVKVTDIAPLCEEDYNRYVNLPAWCEEQKNLSEDVEKKWNL